VTLESKIQGARVEAPHHEAAASPVSPLAPAPSPTWQQRNREQWNAYTRNYRLTHPEFLERDRLRRRLKMRRIRALTNRPVWAGYAPYRKEYMRHYFRQRKRAELRAEPEYIRRYDQ
jgi:hypothetical protein